MSTTSRAGIPRLKHLLETLARLASPFFGRPYPTAADRGGDCRNLQSDLRAVCGDVSKVLGKGPAGKESR